jgi:hypothetical protein
MEPLDSNRVSLSQSMKDRFGNLLAHLQMDISDADQMTLDLSRE